MNYAESFIQDYAFKDNVVFDEPLKKHTTFKIGGNCDAFVVPKSVEELEMALRICREKQIPYFVMGNGSNLLVRDKGFRGIVICLFKGFDLIKVEENEILAMAGATLSRVANEAMKNGLSGFEFASGIPGTVGGGVFMNAGAYGGEMKDVVKEVVVLSDGKIKTLKNEDCAFGYRSSLFQRNDDIVISVRLSLEKGDSEEIKENIKELNQKRNEKQPVNLPSAGSTFKRPEGYFAAKLIDDSGLRGFSVGDAQVSPKHCGFVVNNGNASCNDVLMLIERVKAVVFEKFGVSLELEVRVIGEE